MSNAVITVQQLITQRASAKNNESGWKNESKRIDGALAEIIKPEDHLKKTNKHINGGSTTVEDSGGKFVIEAEKKVVWDSAKLQTIASGMAWQMVESTFKIKFEMTETQYKNCQANAKAGLLDPKVMALIDDARTVTIGEAKIKSAEII